MIDESMADDDVHIGPPVQLALDDDALLLRLTINVNDDVRSISATNHHQFSPTMLTMMSVPYRQPIQLVPWNEVREEGFTTAGTGKGVSEDGRLLPRSKRIGELVSPMAKMKKKRDNENHVDVYPRIVLKLYT